MSVYGPKPDPNSDKQKILTGDQGLVVHLNPSWQPPRLQVLSTTGLRLASQRLMFLELGSILPSMETARQLRVLFSMPIPHVLEH